MNRSEIQDVLRDVAFPGYTFHVAGEQRYYIQATFVAQCAESGNYATQYTRKWYISSLATRGEIVQTALKCVLTSLEHEARENFRYKGRAVFGPHFDVDKLWAICGDAGLDRRAA